MHGEKSDISYILSQASIGILASTEEGFPVTLLEYAFANLAVVSTNVGYCSRIIQNEFNGLLFDPGYENELKLQLLRVIENNSLRSELANNFKHLVVREYSEEKVIGKLISEYKKIN